MLAADVESFRRLVERYQRPLLTLIRNLTPPDTDHEGVAQEVFLAAFRSLASFDPKRSAFSTWLFTIARNRCRNELARRRPVVGAELPEVVDLRSPERAASEAELFRQLDAALDALPFEQRSAFVLAHLQGLSYEETNAGRRYRILFATDTKPLRFDDTPPSPHVRVHTGDRPADIRDLAARGPHLRRFSSRPISPPSSHLFEPDRPAGRWLPLLSPLPRSGRLRARLAPVTRYRQSATGSMMTQTSTRHPILIHDLVESSHFMSGAETREGNHRRVARQLLIFFAHEFGRSGSKSERAAPSAPQMPDTRSSP